MPEDKVFAPTPEGLFGGLKPTDGPPLLPNAPWHAAVAAGSGIQYRFPEGALVGFKTLTSDFMVDAVDLVVFRLTLQMGADGAKFGMIFSALNGCQARFQMDLDAVHQNRWRYDRDGAFLKPMCCLERVDLTRVDRMTLEVHRKSEAPIRFCLTPLTLRMEPLPSLTEPVLLRGNLLDALGQNAQKDWHGKTRTVEQMITRLRGQMAVAEEQQWPDEFSEWGGDKTTQVGATGFFRTHHDGKRWWLVDPAGHLFWSSGMDCVRLDVASFITGLETTVDWLPDTESEFTPAFQGNEVASGNFSYHTANLIRAFGPDWRESWEAIALSHLRQAGINSFGNWSEWEVASRARVPYVRPIELELKRTPFIYRDFPDVFAPSFAEEASEYAQQLSSTAQDPALIGYFLMNEPTWGFAEETPAAGMLFNTPACESRKALAEFLKQKYAGDADLAAAWLAPITFADVAGGVWTHSLNSTAKADLEAFSAVMTERLFATLSDACKRVDPVHLNLGARYYTVPPKWAIGGMKHFDVFSMNCYKERVPVAQVTEIAELLGMPVLIGEWHFGALDVGLPGSGIGRVRDQQARGVAYRVYVENAAAIPACVGVHYFTLYDESALGRYDGENWNIGFLDVCGRPYEGLMDAARTANSQIYAVASGKEAAFDQSPEYLPLVFL